MIKKLRNKMLMMNMVSTFCLIIVAFSVIYAMIYAGAEVRIEQELRRSFSFNRPMHWREQPGPALPAEGTLSEGKTNSSQPKPPFERELRDTGSFSVFVDNEGNVHTDSFLGENSEHYEAVANTALKQNAEEGEFTEEGIVWRFETHHLGNNARIIALLDISAEKSLLRMMLVCFAVGALVLLILIYLISLYFANKAIKPVTLAWEQQKQFVADASHELKTPLAAINTNIDVLLANKGKTIESEEKWLRYIKSEVQRLSELTGNLLFMAKMNADVKIEKMNVSLSEIVESAVLNLEAVAFEKGVQFDYDIEENITGNVNSSQITRLCLILLDNAIKYSPKEHPVCIRLRKYGKEQALLTVQNMGDTIPEEDIGKIFDRFYRVDKSRSTSGYGLGLAMAKEIVTMHNGKISVKSSDEEGTEFAVVLPL